MEAFKDNPGLPGTCRTHIGRFLHNRTGSADIVIYYVIFGACWIFFSDLLVSRLATDTALYSDISIIKGWLFIAITALLLYVLIQRRVRMTLALQARHVGEIEERERRIMQANRLYAVLSAVNRSIIRTSGQQELLNEVCRILVAIGGFKTAWIGWPDDDGWVVPTARCGDESSYLSSIRISVRDIPEGHGPTGTAIRERRAAVCDNITTNPAMAVWRETALHNGFASSACFPFSLPDGSMAGLTIYSAETDFFKSDEERNLLGEVADDMEFALQMLHTAKAHRVAEQRLKEVIDNSPAVIYAFDGEGRLLLANAAMATVCGRPLEELQGRYREEIGISPEMAQVHRDNDLVVLANGTAQVFEEINLQGDGLHTYLTVKFPLSSGTTDDAGTVVAGISTDITARKLAEDELQKKNDEIEQFIYTVSHDLRSPLVTIKTFMGYLERDLAGNDPEQLAQDIRFIHSAADKMKLLLDELLEMCRIGRVETPPKTVALKEVLAEVLEVLAGIVSDRTADIRLPDTELMLFGNRPRLCQIWQNLIENAIKYSSAAPPRIELGIRQENGETVFFVKDHGIGIPPEYHGRIFGIFDKLDPKSPGAGLGLPMVERIVQKYGGRIWVESEGPGTGSTFRFTLPGALLHV